MIARLFLVGTGLALLPFPAGCTRPPAAKVEEKTPLYDGQVTKVVAPSEAVASLIKRYAPAWSNRTGARIEVVSAPADGDLTKVAQADIWVVGTAEMPRWAAAGLLNPLPPAIRAAGGEYAWQNLLPIYREKLLRWAGETYALPLVGDALLCFYRADLFADQSHKTAYHEQYHRELAAPRTWDEFADIAEYFHSRRNPGQATPSLPPLPEDVNDLDTLLEAIAAPHSRREAFQNQEDGRPVSDEELFSYHYHLKTGDPRIEGPGFVAALQLLEKMQRFRPKGASAEPEQAFADDRAVLCIAEASAIARFRKKLPPAATGVCTVPGSARWFRFSDGKEMTAPPDGNHIPYQGSHGLLLVVPRTAPHRDAAFDLCARLSDRDIGTQIVFEPRWAGGVYRQEHLKPGPNWFSFDLDASRTQNLREAIQQSLARPGLMNPVVRLRIPDQATHQSILVEEIRKALEKNADAKQALQEVAVRWKELDDKKDKKQRINEYRISLGLSALP
jgi:multiple sugar transport system substrate-binding protein